MVNNYKRLQKYRDEINCLIDNKQFDEGLVKTKAFIKLIKRHKKFEYDYWFAYYSVARVYNYLGMTKEAMTNMLIAKRYETKDQYSYHYGIWMIGRIYSNSGKKNKALKIYKECERYFTSIGKPREYVILRNNISLITKDLSLINSTIQEYENSDNEYERKDYVLNMLKETKEEIIQMLKINEEIA